MPLDGHAELASQRDAVALLDLARRAVGSPRLGPAVQLAVRRLREHRAGNWLQARVVIPELDRTDFPVHGVQVQQRAEGKSNLAQGLFPAGQVHLHFHDRVARIGTDGDESALGRRLGVRQVLGDLDRDAVVGNGDPLGQIAVNRDPLHPALVMHGQHAGLAQIVGRLQEVVRHRGDGKRQQFMPRGPHNGFAAKHVRGQPVFGDGIPAGAG